MDKMEEDAERMEGSMPSKGGLTVYKQKEEGQDAEKKRSEGSKYGLDKLATVKREEREKERERMREEKAHGNGDRDGEFAVPAPRMPSSSYHRKEKHYRDRRAETPGSTPGRSQSSVSSQHHSQSIDRDALYRRREREKERNRVQRGLEYKSSRSNHASRQERGRPSSDRFSNVTKERSEPRTPSRLGWDGRTPQRSTWDASPMHNRGRTPNIRETPMTERLPSYFQGEDEGDTGTEITEEELKAFEQEEERLDREWYLQDDENPHMYDASGMDDAGVPAADEELAKKQARRLSARAAQLHEDASRWEEQQMKLGGAGGPVKELSMDFDEDSGPRFSLLVKDTVPPFLSGKIEETTVADTVVPIKDPTSDMAVIARKGSLLVKKRRELRERNKSRTKYWELGTDTVGAKQKSAEEETREKEETERSILEMKSVKAGEDEDNDGSGRRSMQYAETMKVSKKGEDADAMAEILRQRRSLPVYTVRGALLQIVRDNQVVIIVGETGSGKTTQLTQYLLEDGYGSCGLIGCTQPRRVAAVSVAKRVAEEMNVTLGKEVGYAIRFEDCTSKETKIKYMTDGILLRETLSDPELDAYSCVVMDEAHERSLNTDVLFGVLRKVLARRRDLRVIVTSATMNADRFATFFGSAPIFNIPGRTFPVDVFFSKGTTEDYVDAAVRQVLQIHIQAPLPGDILVFMTGQEDIEVTCEVLAERMEKLENPPPLLILPIYSQLAADMQARIFEPAPEGARKVIVATNIAETSLTVDGVSFVVDSGYCKLKTYNPRIGMDALLLCPTSRASANQRSGRAGRTGPGRTYRLYPASAYANEMLESSVPEIQRTNLAHVVLLLKSLGVQDLLDFDFMDPPPQENIVKSMLGLWMLGALDNQGELTELGRRMATFPLDPSLSRMLLAGEKEGCSQEVVTIVAMLSVPSVFYRPRDREEEADLAREKFFVPESDHLTLLHVYQRWRSGGSRVDWCAKHFLNAKGLRRAKEVRSQLLDVMKDEKVKLNTCGTDWDSIRKAVTTAYFYQAARMKGIGEYINMRSGVVCSIHPTSALYGAGFTPNYVVYHELIYTQKEYMSCITAVEPQWLAQMGSMFFTLKQSGGGGTWVDKSAEHDGEEKTLSASVNERRQAQALDARLEASRKRAKGGGMVTPGTPRRSKIPRTPGRFGL